jgi:hypothetical protein
MKISRYHAIGLLIIFSAIVLGFAFRANQYFPLRAIAGEQSTGTWLSGTLLMIMASLSLVLSMHHRRYPWIILTVFFLILAADEHFMFHEHLKGMIMFSGATSRWIYELPSIIGAVVGCFISVVVWKTILRTNRFLLLIAVAMGLVSVAIDVVAGSVLWEELLKLGAELILVSLLLLEVSDVKQNTENR